MKSFYREDKELPKKICGSLDSFLFIQGPNGNICCTTIYSSLHICRKPMICLVQYKKEQDNMLQSIPQGRIVLTNQTMGS